jgi:hypothetical protein
VLELGAVPVVPLLDAELLLSVPITRMWWPTWSLNFEVSPESCQVLPDWSVNVQLPAEPFKQPSIELPLSLDVCVVWVVVLWVVVELVSGVVDWLLGEVDDGDVDDGDVDCCELASGVVDCGELLLGEVCATAQTADNNRIAVIKDVFLMYVPPGLFGLPPALKRVEAALNT